MGKERGAFSGCSSLRGVTLPPNLAEIGGHAFFGCTSLSEITLPPDLTEIGQRAFGGCASLSEITLPPNLTEIGNGAFSRCASLSEITLPPNLTEIGNDAFFSCVSLSEITLPPTLTEIVVGAFEGCTALSEIMLPPTLTEIGESAFAGCKSLSDRAPGRAGQHRIHGLRRLPWDAASAPGTVVGLKIRKIDARVCAVQDEAVEARSQHVLFTCRWTRCRRPTRTIPTAQHHHLCSANHSKIPRGVSPSLFGYSILNTHLQHLQRTYSIRVGVTSVHCELFIHEHPLYPK